MRFVIVDDDPGVRHLIAAAVGSFGWDVEVGASAVALTRSIARADLVTLDVHLGAEDGLDALRAYRKGGGTAPVVVLTADDSAKVHRAATRAGATAVVIKPFEMLAFLDLLSTLATTRHDPKPQMIDLTEPKADAAERRWFES